MASPDQDSDVPILETEHEPLLGQPGDAAQKSGHPIYENLILGMYIYVSRYCEDYMLISTKVAEWLRKREYGLYVHNCLNLTSSLAATILLTGEISSWLSYGLESFRIS
jgi:hypothetical protein